jgi:hypothetical protein
MQDEQNETLRMIRLYAEPFTSRQGASVPWTLPSVYVLISDDCDWNFEAGCPLQFTKHESPIEVKMLFIKGTAA